jgi:hypothetical protein
MRTVNPFEPVTTSDPTNLLIDPLRDFQEAIAARARGEQTLAEQFGASSDPQEVALSAAVQELDEAHALELAELEQQIARRRDAVVERHRSAGSQIRAELSARIAGIQQQARDETERLSRKYEDSRWIATSLVDETAEDSPKRQYERDMARLDKTGESLQLTLETLLQEVHEVMSPRGWTGELDVQQDARPGGLDETSAEIQEDVAAARERLDAFQRLRVPRLFVGMRPLWLFVVATAVIGPPLFLFVRPGLVGVAPDATSTWLALTAGTAVLVSLLLLTVLYTISSLQVSDALSRLAELCGSARQGLEQWLAAADGARRRAEREYESKRLAMETQLQGQLARFEGAFRESLADIERRRQDDVRVTEDERQMRLAAIDEARDRDLADDELDLRTRREALVAVYTTERDRRQTALDAHQHERQQAFQATWESLAGDWQVALGRLEAWEQQQSRLSDARFAPWAVLAGPGWTPAESIPESIRIGEFDVALESIDGAISPHAALALPRTRMRIPAALPFPGAPSLLLRTDGPRGRREAVQALLVALLRMLTRIPPGSLRLTVFDPIGLGESFAGLMHLTDFDELLVTSRIWTETGQFEARLADLTEHMENVLQKYLRNEYATIEEYNRFAGEVAEPYRVLVVADFPHKFSEQAARRLASIATSGPRCGVFLLMSVDGSAPVPHGCDMATIERAVTTLDWRVETSVPAVPADVSRDELWGLEPDGRAEAVTADGTRLARDRAIARAPGQHAPAPGAGEPAFHWRHPELARWPVILDAPPPPELFTQIVRNVGEASKDVRRVEVPFARIAPPPGEVWIQDSRQGIDIPLGRAGATKLQHLRLGKGTSQHMLVAGKTGSGKSTFFHALITNAAMRYSPEELEFYLVDFKKGVEFKAYAAHGLPHARVIAIESDREFGVSVLQRLDQVLQERGDLFRRHGVQDIAACRDLLEDRQRRHTGTSVDSRSVSTPLPGQNGGDRVGGERADRSAVTLPRILLVVDEFQEFFVEEDRYAQQAALLLDRLIRQGRAFGIHVLLGSQTLGGAYSLARTTLGQVAVRVALQCSDADAHLILSEDNTAARLLTRPGEAIYNDANGLVEGNHPFQIAWLPDAEREGYLAVLRHYAHERQTTAPPPLVFEGHVPSDPARNGPLSHLIAQGERLSEPLDGAQPSVPVPADAAVPVIWLGESVEIGPPTSVSFPEQSGSNLLLVGPDLASAQGILETAAVTLAMQPGPAARELRDTSGSPLPRIWIFDGNTAGSIEAARWKHIAGLLGDGARIITSRTAAGALESLTAERIRRLESAAETRVPLFVLVANLSKFRELRRSEDEFSFGSLAGGAAESPAPSRRFGDLLARGPEVGLHAVVWVDTAGNLERWVSRQALREFELRVAFPMNASDSSQFIDSPAASRLGVFRALLYREETGTVTKFRPYGPPSEDWLNWVARRLASRSPLKPATSLDQFSVH